MKLSQSSTTNLINWNSPLTILAKKKVPESLLKLLNNGFETLADLIWIFPLRIQKAPKLACFSQIMEDQLFLGKGKLVSLLQSPAYSRRGKGGVQLYNITAVIQDITSSDLTHFKWFNAYPNMKNKLESADEFYFLGLPTSFKGQIQFINPILNPKNIQSADSMLIEYPTVNTVPGKQIQKFIEQIPSYLWQQGLSSFSQKMNQKLKQTHLLTAFKVMHGLSCDLKKEDAEARIIYEEFFSNQLKILARKLKQKNKKAPQLKISKKDKDELLTIFPYELTLDQKNVFESVLRDFQSGNPMMRMLQGDVGCGKTTVAMLASLVVSSHKGQTALMCPTEALANQHLTTFKSILGEKVKIEILTGSTKAKNKKEIETRLLAGDIELIIGTHALIQDNIQFKSLFLCIIDEQHKFGVNQRLKLATKGSGVHSLIMSATPIPRTLQLAQYGDLDISTIRTMPSGRKGTKTRIVTHETYEKYLSFLKTRIELQEQVYIVVPAIEESEVLAINNINSMINQYKKYFPEYNIQILHGQLKPQDKSQVMQDFANKKIHILISTTVIEVGINVLNSTVMAIYNPERFGLSSLHQLRGRVGRGDKPGFCFLVATDKISPEAMQRLKVIEKTTDGFEISEADLKNRGEGDMFGSDQSGYKNDYKLASIFEHFDIFEKVSRDIANLQKSEPEALNQVLLELSSDTKVSTTI